MHAHQRAIAIYKSPTGTVDVRLDGDTVWLTQEQMTQLFGRERSVITKHIRNVFNESELDEKSNVQNLHIPHSDKPVRFYNLDVIISVGYRVKSPQGVNLLKFNPEKLSQASEKGSAARRNLGPTWSGSPEKVERLACNATFGWRLSLWCRSGERPLQNDVDFLHRNGRLLNASGHPVINDMGLAALALLVAESDPGAKRRAHPPHRQHAGTGWGGVTRLVLRRPPS